MQRRILIVDDEHYNLLGLQVILDAASSRKGILDLIDTANNGMEALNMVQSTISDGKSPYGLIFMDCSMPIMDGYDATTAIRQLMSSSF